MTTASETLTPPPPPPRRGPGFWPTVLLPILAIVSAFVLAFIVAGVLFVAGLSDEDATTIAGFVASGLIVAAGLLLLLWLPRSERQLAAQVRHSWGGAIGMGIVIGIGIIIVAVSILAASTLIDTPFERPVDEVDNAVGDATWQLVLAVIAFVILAPVGEEILFRAFLYRGLATRLPFFWAALISSVIFAAFHFDVYEIGWPRGLALIATGFALAWLYRWRGLPASITAHATVNLVAAIALIASS